MAELVDKNNGFADNINKLKLEIEELKSAQSEEKQTLESQNNELKEEIHASKHTIKILTQQLEEHKKLVNEKEKLLDSYKELDAEVKNISAESEKIDKESIDLKLEMKEVETKPFHDLKIVHFDLKGAPPKIDYLTRIIKQSKQLGADGFLIEYEDMFPYTEELSILASQHSYTQEDIETIVNLAVEQELIIIPLIQTFGHLEFALKHGKFKPLRENKNISNSVCPLNSGTFPFLQKMIDQIQAAHPNSAWIHLGGDEVWNIKTCDKCLNSKLSKAGLFTQHMTSLFEYCKSLKTDDEKSVKPIIWDDMMRKWSVEELKVMAEYVTPMVWAYQADLDSYFRKDLWENYAKAFPSIWIASSFKGALKAYSDFVPIKQHLDNHLSWLKITTRLQKNGVKINGIVLTGWSRFDHYGPLCELLPAGIPSLALCLAVLTKGKFDKNLHQQVSQTLGFKKTFKINVYRFNKYTPESATYYGGDYYNLVGYLEKALGWKIWADTRSTGWSRPYQNKRKHLSFYQLNATIAGLKTSEKNIDYVKLLAKSVLEKYFDDYVVDEWIHDKLDYQLESIAKSMQEVSQVIKNNDFM